MIVEQVALIASNDSVLFDQDFANNKFNKDPDGLRFDIAHEFFHLGLENLKEDQKKQLKEVYQTTLQIISRSRDQYEGIKAWLGYYPNWEEEGFWGEYFTNLFYSIGKGYRLSSNGKVTCSDQAALALRTVLHLDKNRKIAYKSYPFLKRIDDRVVTQANKIIEDLKGERGGFIDSSLKASSSLDSQKTSVVVETGGIDLSNIELLLEDEGYIKASSPVSLRVLCAAKYLERGWDSLSLLYVHEVMGLIRDKIITEIEEYRDVFVEVLNRLKAKQVLDSQANEFFQMLQLNKPISSIRITLS